MGIGMLAAENTKLSRELFVCIVVLILLSLLRYAEKKREEKKDLDSDNVERYERYEKKFRQRLRDGENLLAVCEVKEKIHCYCGITEERIFLEDEAESYTIERYDFSYSERCVRWVNIYLRDGTKITLDRCSERFDGVVAALVAHYQYNWKTVSHVQKSKYRLSKEDLKKAQESERE